MDNEVQLRQPMVSEVDEMKVFEGKRYYRIQDTTDGRAQIKEFEPSGVVFQFGKVLLLLYNYNNILDDY